MLTIEAPDFRTLFDPIDFTSGAIAAVSGGSDSTALLLLLKDYLDRNAPGAKFLAVTVDHGLRSGSAAEARDVAQLCAMRGIAHRTLQWIGPKPSTGLPAAARTARYGLLAKAAIDAGIGLVLTGHTADDQAETVRMRMQRGTVDAERRGLAGMAPATLLEAGQWLLRPFLGVRRQALRDELQRLGIGWADDPTNEDQHYERPRVRVMLDDADVKALLALAQDAAGERRSLDMRAADLLRRVATQPSKGLLCLSPDFPRTADPAAGVYALRVLLAVLGGGSFLPDETRAAALFARLGAAEPVRATLSRVVIDVRRRGIFLYRESRGLPLPLAANDGMIWDGRRRITFGNRNGGTVIAPLGIDAASKEVVAARIKPQSLVRRAMAAEPALVDCGKNTQLASALPLIAPWVHFLPDFDLETARAISDLFGAAPVPEPPVSNRAIGSTRQVH